MKKCEAVVEAWVAHCEASDEIQRPNFKGLMNCHDERFHIWEITKVQRNVCGAFVTIWWPWRWALPKVNIKRRRGGRWLCGLRSLPLMVGFVVARRSHLMLGRILLHRKHVINNRAQVMDLNGPRLCMIDPSSQRNVFEVQVGALRCG